MSLELYGHMSSLMKVLNMKEVDGFPSCMPDISFNKVMEKTDLNRRALILTAKESCFEFSRKILIAEFEFSNKELMKDEKLKQQILVDCIETMDFVSVQKMLENSEYMFALRLPLGLNLLNLLIFYNCPFDFLVFVIYLLAFANFVDKRKVINGRDSFGFTPLISSVLAGYTECMKLLLEIGANVDDCGKDHCNSRDAQQWESIYMGDKTPLMYATCLGNLNDVELLLRYQPRLNNNYEHHRDCLNEFEYASLYGKTECLQLLITYATSKTNLDASNKNGREIFSSGDISFMYCNSLQEVLNRTVRYAIYGGSIDCLQLLLDHCNGFDINNNLPRLKETPLLLAIDCGHPECLELILERGANINTLEYSQDSVLDCAVRKGNLKCLEVLLKHKDFKELKMDVLELAVNHGQAECIPFLLKNGAKKKQTEQILTVAAENKYWECFKLVLEHNVCFEVGNDLLYCIAHNGNIDHLNLLLRCKQVSKSKILKNSEFLKAAISVNNIEIVAFLLKHCDDDNIFKRNENNILINAVCGGHLECVSLVIDQVINRGKQPHLSKHAKTISVKDLAEPALPYSLPDGKDESLELLLPHCDFLDHLNDRQKTVLMVAAEKGKAECVQMLIGRKVNLNFHNRQRVTATLFATKDCLANCLKILLENGADPNAGLLNGSPALVIAVKYNHIECVKLLIKHKADVNYLTKDGNTATVLATKDGLLNCLQVLLENGADPNTGFYNGSPALILAINNNDVECVKLLMKYKADVNCLTKDGNSAILTSIHRFSNLDNKMTPLLFEAGGRIDISDFYEHEVLLLFMRNPQKLKNVLQQRLLTRDNKFPKHKGKRFDMTRNYYCNVYKWKSLRLLMEYDLFDYSFWIKGNEGMKNTILLLAILSKLSPDQFKNSERSKSALLHALEAMDEGVVSYLISNLYLTWDDYVSITNNRLSITDSDDSLLSQKPNVNRVLNYPWRLQYLCLLKVSTSLFKHNETKDKVLTRDKMVKTLNIPETFKRVLNFNLKQSLLCPKYWKVIGKSPGENVQDIMKITRTCYPVNLKTLQCLTKCETCYSSGLKPVGVKLPEVDENEVSASRARNFNSRSNRNRFSTYEDDYAYASDDYDFDSD